MIPQVGHLNIYLLGGDVMPEEIDNWLETIERIQIVELYLDDGVSHNTDVLFMQCK